MRKVISLFLVVVMSAAMIMCVTGCKKTTHYTEPMKVIEGFENGDKIIEQNCTVTVKANRVEKTIRREIYSSIFDDKYGIGADTIVIVSLPPDQTMNENETATLVITDIKGSDGFYEIYAYKK